MKFVAIADTHMAESECPPGDVLLHAGDLTYEGMAVEVAGVARWLKTQKERQGYKQVVVIAGNHDWLFQREPEAARRIMKENGLVYLQDSAVTLGADASVTEGLCPGPGRITIYGSPWQPEFMNWAFNLKRGSELRAKWDMIPAGIDILMTHGPPHGILDGVGWPSEDVEPGDSSKAIRHLGCEELIKAVERVKPKVHVFGHIHASRGRLVRDGTTFINASIMNEIYDPTRKPIVFDYPVQVDGHA